MADELRVTASVSYEKDNDTLAFSPDTTVITVAGQQRAGGVQQITTTKELLVMNEILVTTQGWAWFRNIGTDSALAIQIGIVVGGTFHDVLELNGGEFAVSRLAGEQLYAQAVGSTQYLEYSILET